MEHSLQRRSILGIAVVVLLAGLCFAAVWSVRGRVHLPPSPVAASSPDDQGIRAENGRLRMEVARLTAERDAALARSNAAVRGAVKSPPVSARPAPSITIPHGRHVATAAPSSSGFVEPQTFGSASTAY